MMFRFAFRFVLLLLVAVAAEGTSHLTSGPHVADVNILLPPKMTNPVEYRLQGSDGCFKWSWDHHDILSVVPEYNSSNHCSTSARLRSIAPYSGRKETAVYATDAYSGTVIRCKVFIDNFSRIQIFHSSIKLDLDGLATLRVRAFDSEDNVFSSLVGLKFMWQLIPETDGSSHHLLHVPLKDSPLSDCGGLCGDLDVQIELENSGVFSDLYVVKGIGIGHEMVSVHLLETEFMHMADSILLTVAEAMSIEPPSPVFVLVGAALQYKLKVIRGNIPQVVALPSPHHRWSVSNSSVAQVDNMMGLTQALRLGQTAVIVEDTRVAGHTQVSSLNVVLPDTLWLYISPLSISGDPVEGTKAIPSVARWFVVSGFQYLIQMKVFSQGPGSQEIYITGSDDIKLSDNQSECWRTFSMPNDLLLKHGWRNSRILKATSQGLGKLTASLTYFSGLHDTKEVLKVVQEIMVCDRIKFSLDQTNGVSESILLPWAPGIYQEVELMATGGCAKTSSDYKWFSSDMATVSITASGVVQAKKPGKATVKVVSIFDSFNYDEIVIEVSTPSSMVMLRNFPVETVVGSHLQAAVTMKTLNGAYFYRCDAFSSSVNWKAGSESFIVLNATKKQPFLDKLGTVEHDISLHGPPCSWAHLYASSSGRTMLHATLSKDYQHFDRSFDGPIVLKASSRIAAYPPLIVQQAGDGSGFGGYWFNLGQSETTTQMEALDKLYLVPRTHVDVLLVGGPEPWEEDVDFIETFEIFNGKHNHASDGVHIHVVSGSSKNLYGVFCQTLGTFELVFKRGNLVGDDHPLPAVAEVSLSVTCSFPASIVLLVDEPVNERKVIQTAAQADRSPGRIRVTPVTVANGQTIRIAAVGISSSGDAFANSSSLCLGWELSNCDGLAYWDDAYGSQKSASSWERFLVLQNESGLCVVRATASGFCDAKDGHHSAQLLEISESFLTDAVRLQLVSTLSVNPEYNLLCFNPDAKELDTGRMIGNAREYGGLYYFDDGNSMFQQQKISNLKVCFSSTDDTIMLWHRRLGHPSFLYLKHLFPNLFRNKLLSSFQCDICQLAKHHRASFPSQPYKASKPFTLIHSDVWGPSRTLTNSGKRWFITFIDDHTRLSWVYLLKEKSEAEHVFKNFYNMVETQFQTKIQVFRSDNGKEYFNQILGSFFLQKGIVHHSSCNDTPQQNGIAERKNKHLLEVARSLMFTTKVPKYLWGEAILTATYLINRMPSRVLNFQTPLTVLKKFFPMTRLTSDLPLKVFGCVAFVHIHNHNRDKLDPRAVKCVFLGYSPTQKGYKCFDPNKQKFFVTMDVTFFESQSFFNPPLQGGKENENSVFELDMSTNGKENIETEIFNPNTLNMEDRRTTLVPEHKTDSRIIDETRFNDERLFGKTYTREKRIQSKKDAVILPQCHESDPIPDLKNTDSENPGTISKFIESESLSIPQIHSDPLDLPIALRKGIRSCTQHPISNFVSYKNLSSSYHTFVSQLSSVDIPKSIQEALKVPEWKKAVCEEMEALEKNGTWEMVYLPEGRLIVGCKWIFTVKYNSDGSLERYKARLVAKGFTQTYGVDYQETFAPVAKLNTIRILLSVAVNLDWPLFQLDVKNAFLNGELEEEVYMNAPPGFEDKFGGKVCKLKKSLYGLKQSPRAWFERFTKFVRKEGYSQGQSDHTMFVKHTDGGKMAVLIVYVDDIILTGSDGDEMSRLKKHLASEFEIKDLGPLRYFLGMEVARSRMGISVSQRKYVLDLLEETGMSGCRPSDTPVDPNQKLGEVSNGVPVDKGRYQRLVGKLIYLSHTRPDIAFAVSAVSQYMHSPYVEHLEAVHKILRYLKSTPGKGLLFKKSDQRSVEVFTDADWAGSVSDRRSTSGYCTFLWGNLITWRSKKQNVVARSSTEAEFRAMANGVCEVLWIKRVLGELKLDIEAPMRLFCDNKSAISIANNPVQHDRTKHIEIDRHFIKEKLENGVICMPFIPSEQQTADVLTKGHFRPKFESFIDKLGMINIYAPT